MKPLMQMACIGLLALSTMAYAGSGRHKTIRPAKTTQVCPKTCDQSACNKQCPGNCAQMACHKKG